MLHEVLDILFGCNHQFSFPIRLRGGDKSYQVCICCGAEYEYDWNRMQRLGPLEQEPKPRRAPELPKAA